MGKLLEYAKEAALYATKNQLPNLSFAFNHHGNPDVAMFDFTSMFQVFLFFIFMLLHLESILDFDVSRRKIPADLLFDVAKAFLLV